MDPNLRSSGKPVTRVFGPRTPVNESFLESCDRSLTKPALAGMQLPDWDVCPTVPTLSVCGSSTWLNWGFLFIAVVGRGVAGRVCRLSGVLQACFLCLLWCQPHGFSSGARSLSSMKLLEMNEPLLGLSALCSVGASCALGLS